MKIAQAGAQDKTLMSLTETVRMWGNTMQLTESSDQDGSEKESAGPPSIAIPADGTEPKSNPHSTTLLSATAPEFEFGMHHVSSDSGDDFDFSSRSTRTSMESTSLVLDSSHLDNLEFSFGNLSFDCHEQILTPQQSPKHRQASSLLYNDLQQKLPQSPSSQFQHQHQLQHQTQTQQHLPQSSSQQVAQPQPLVVPQAQALSPSMQAYTSGLGRTSSSGTLSMLSGAITSHQHMDYLRQTPGAGALSPAMKPLGYSGMHAMPLSMTSPMTSPMQAMQTMQTQSMPAVPTFPYGYPVSPGSSRFPKSMMGAGNMMMVMGPGGMMVPLQGAQMAKMHQRNEALYREEPESADGYIYQVQFKRSHRNFALHPSAPGNIMPGDFVRVEADRGEDLGVVLARVPAADFKEPIPTAGYRGRGFFSGHNERKWLFRQASVTERLQIRDKVEDEEEALRVICEQVALRCLPMTILDVEYQFDRHKLVFFFEADRRIDFRDLVSELFSLYKTRIWMQQVDTTMLSDEDPGTVLAKKVGLLPDRGTPLNLPQSYYQRHEAIMAAAGSYDTAGGLLSDEWVNDMNMSQSQPYPALKASSLASMGKMPTAYAATAGGGSTPEGSAGPAYGNMYAFGYGVTGGAHGSQNSSRYGHTGASKPPVQSQLSASYMHSNMGSGSIAAVNDAPTYRTTQSMAQSILHSPLSALSNAAPGSPSGDSHATGSCLGVSSHGHGHIHGNGSAQIHGYGHGNGAQLPPPGLGGHYSNF